MFVEKLIWLVLSILLASYKASVACSWTFEQLDLNNWSEDMHIISFVLHHAKSCGSSEFCKWKVWTLECTSNECDFGERFIQWSFGVILSVLESMRPFWLCWMVITSLALPQRHGEQNKLFSCSFIHAFIYQRVRQPASCIEATQSHLIWMGIMGCDVTSNCIAKVAGVTSIRTAGVGVPMNEANQVCESH